MAGRAGRTLRLRYPDLHHGSLIDVREAPVGPRLATGSGAMAPPSRPGGGGGSGSVSAVIAPLPGRQRRRTRRRLRLGPPLFAAAALLPLLLLLRVPPPARAASLTSPSDSETLPALFWAPTYGSAGANASAAAARRVRYRPVTYAWRPRQPGPPARLGGPDLHGWSLALSGDGAVLAAGSLRSDGPFGDAPRSGMVTIYRWRPAQATAANDDDDNGVGDSGRAGNGTPAAWSGYQYYDGSEDDNYAADDNDANAGWLWETLQFHGREAGDKCGYSVALDASGTVLAMGAPQSNGDQDLPNRGQVRVLAYDGAEWHPRGADIEGPDADDLCGYAVALAADGGGVLAGCPFAGNRTGVTRAFLWGGGVWSAWGSSSSSSAAGAGMAGRAPGDDSGAAVAVNARTTLAIVGAPNRPVEGQPQAGAAQVYRYDWYAAAWAPRGPALRGGAAAGDRFGYSVAMSDSGNVVAVGAPYASRPNNATPACGRVRAFLWNSILEDWIQLGSDLFGSGAGDQFGGSLAMSSAGTVLAIGGHLTDTANGADSGVVRVYGWDGDDWRQMGEDLPGEAPNEYSGWSVALSGDGRVVAVGAPYTGGKVRLFQRADVPVSTSSSQPSASISMRSAPTLAQPAAMPTESTAPTVGRQSLEVDDNNCSASHSRFRQAWRFASALSVTLLALF